MRRPTSRMMVRYAPPRLSWAPACGRKAKAICADDRGRRMRRPLHDGPLRAAETVVGAGLWAEGEEQFVRMIEGDACVALPSHDSPLRAAETVVGAGLWAEG